jgi:hypothetical protein
MSYRTILNAATYFPQWADFPPEIKVSVCSVSETHLAPSQIVFVILIYITQLKAPSLHDLALPVIRQNMVHYTTIPINEDSTPVLTFLGYNDETAQKICNRYQGSLAGYSRFTGDELWCGANCWIGSYPVPGKPKENEPVDALDDSNDWYAIMDKFGLDKEIQDAIMDPEFKVIRLTRSCKHWVVDTRLRVFHGLRVASLAREQSTRRL